jgi:hypothetical protein
MRGRDGDDTDAWLWTAAVFAWLPLVVDQPALVPLWLVCLWLAARRISW